MWSLRILFLCLSVYFTTATSDLSLSSNVANHLTCDRRWIRSAPSADTSRTRFIQLDKASCVFLPIENIPICLATAKDGQLWEYAQGLWWKVLKPKMPMDSKLSCLLNRNEKVECFVRGFDGAVWSTERVLKSFWTDFTSLGGSTAEAPSCISTDTRKGICFYKDLNGTAHYSKIDNKEYIRWTRVGNEQVASAIRCFRDDSDSASCVALNTRSKAMLLTWNGMSTPRWTIITPEEIRDPPGCVRMGFGERVDCLARGMNNSLVVSYRQSGGSWTDWRKLDKYILSKVECVDAAPGQSACYYVSERMKLRSLRYMGEDWQDYREYKLFYLEEPACTATTNATVFCAGRAVVDLSRQFCELLTDQAD